MRCRKVWETLTLENWTESAHQQETIYTHQKISGLVSLLTHLQAEYLLQLGHLRCIHRMKSSVKRKNITDARLDAESNEHVYSSARAMYDYHLISKLCIFNKKTWGTETWNIKKQFHLHSGLSAKQLASTRSTIRRSISARFS